MGQKKKIRKRKRDRVEFFRISKAFIFTGLLRHQLYNQNCMLSMEALIKNKK